MDDPGLIYVIENFNNKLIFRIERTFAKPIHSLTLKSIKSRGMANIRPWYAIYTWKDSYDIAPSFDIPDRLWDIDSFKVKIQYRYKNHKYTDTLIIYPSERRLELH